jgi:hypothetical protein
MGRPTGQPSLLASGQKANRRVAPAAAATGSANVADFVAINTYALIVCTVKHPGHRNLLPTLPPITLTPLPQLTQRRFTVAGLAAAGPLAIGGVRLGVTATNRLGRDPSSFRS